MKHICTSTSISGQTITLNQVNTPLAGLLLIANNTKGTILYSVGGLPIASGNYTQALNSTITLPSSAIMSANDSLTVYWDDLIAFPYIGGSVSPLYVTPTNLGQTDSSGCSPVVLASDQPAIPVTPAASATAVMTKITTTGNHLISADSSRASLVFFNAATIAAYVLLGSGNASATNFSLVLNTGDTIALNYYTGAYAVYTGSSGTPAFYTTKISA